MLKGIREFLKQMRSKRGLSQCLLGIILVLVAIVLTKFAMDKAKFKLANRGTATIISVMPISQSRFKVLYRYKVKETTYISPVTVDGDEVAYRKGDKVDIIYDPDSPKESSIGFNEDRLFVIIYALIAILPCLVSGLFLLIFGRKFR